MVRMRIHLLISACGICAQCWACVAGMIKWLGGNNKCLDVDSGKDADGTNVQIWTCDANTKNQQFELTNGASQ